MERRFSFPPATVFAQLCPSRELDWIDGWDCDLVYTSTGYVERDCIFTTPEANSLGAGLWIVTGYEPDERLEVVTVTGDALVEHLTITLSGNEDGTCTGVWNMTFTALNDSGNGMIDSISSDAPELTRALDGLEHFLQTGNMLRN